MMAALPGLSWLQETPESLTLYLPHGELRLQSGDLSRVVLAIIRRAAESPCATDVLIELAAESCNVREAIARYALRILEDARCVRQLDEAERPSELDWLFWSRTGTTALGKRVATAQLHCLSYADAAASLERSLNASGLRGTVEALSTGCTSDEIAARMHEAAPNCDALLVAGPRFSHPFTRMLGRTALELDVPVLFVETGGFIARIGPTTFGRDLPCLDCLFARHGANGGFPLNRAVDDLSTAGPVDLPAAPLVHRNVLNLALDLAVIEMCRIVAGEGPQTFGGYLEADWHGEVRRRELHRVPLCNGCSNQAVERFPYHVTPITA